MRLMTDILVDMKYDSISAVNSPKSLKCILTISFMDSYLSLLTRFTALYFDDES